MPRPQRRPAALAILLLALAVLGPARGALGLRDEAGVEPLWHVLTPADAQYVVADNLGSVVTGLRGQMVATDQIGGSMWTVDASTGDERVLSPTALSRSLVFVPVERNRLLALDRRTGREQWHQPIADIVGVSSSSSGDTVSVVTRTRVEVRDGATGSPIWAVDQPIAEVLAARPHVWVRSAVVLLAWTDTVSHLRAFDRGSGRTMWQRDQDTWESAPAVSGDAVFVAENQRLSADGSDTDSTILRLDLATGVVEWERPVRGLFFPTFVGDVDGATFAVVDFRGRTFALDASTGRLRWRRVTDARQFENEAHVVGDVVAFTTLGTGLVVLDRGDGSAVPNESPGRAQPWSVIRASAATGDQLYLLTHPNGSSGETDSVLVMLPTGPDGYTPGYDLDLRPNG